MPRQKVAVQEISTELTSIPLLRSRPGGVKTEILANSQTTETDTMIIPKLSQTNEAVKNLTINSAQDQIVMVILGTPRTGAHS